VQGDLWNLILALKTFTLKSISNEQNSRSLQSQNQTTNRNLMIKGRELKIKTILKKKSKMGIMLLKYKVSLRRNVEESQNPSIYSSNKNKKVNRESKLSKGNRRCKRLKMRKKSNKDRMNTDLTLFFLDSKSTLRNSANSLRKKGKEWLNCSFKENKKRENSSLSMNSKETSFPLKRFLQTTQT